MQITINEILTSHENGQHRQARAQMREGGFTISEVLEEYAENYPAAASELVGMVRCLEIQDRDPEAEQLEAAQANLLKFALLALADLDDQKTGWYYQFSAAAEKVENLTA